MLTMYYNKNYNSTLCSKHEDKGRFIASRCLDSLFRGYTVNFSQTPLTYPVDLVGTVTDGVRCGKFNVEIKERKKTPEQLIKYPHAELRVDKAERMKSVTDENTVCLYMVLLNEAICYVYNLKHIDWSIIETFNWRIKEVQVDPNSNYKLYPTYLLPTSLAVAEVDIREFVKEWYANKF